MSNSAGALKPYVLWHYSPSVPAAATLAAIFLIISTGHLYRLLKFRKWFCTPLVVSSICKTNHSTSAPSNHQAPFYPLPCTVETIGYIGRILSHSHPTSSVPYAIQQLFILLAPILFAASVYMFLGRLISTVQSEHLSRIRTTWLTKVFVCGDILCFLMQGGGGGIMSAAKTMSKFKLGENVILGGLVLQVIVFVFFIIVAAVFHARMRRATSAATITVANREPGEELQWERLLWSLYAVSLLILLRNVVRCVEYGMGYNGYLLAHEFVTYVFDAAPMVIVLVTCWFWYRSGVAKQQRRMRRGERGIRSPAEVMVEPKVSR